MQWSAWEVHFEIFSDFCKVLFLPPGTQHHFLMFLASITVLDCLVFKFWSLKAEQEKKGNIGPLNPQSCHFSWGEGLATMGVVRPQWPPASLSAPPILAAVRDENQHPQCLEDRNLFTLTWLGKLFLEHVHSCLPVGWDRKVDRDRKVDSCCHTKS